MTNTVNYLSPASFKLVVPRAENLEFHCTGVTLPTLSVAEAPFSTPQRDLQMPADKLNYESLTVKMIVDENMLNYKEIFSWINSLVYENDDNLREKMEDLTLVVMSSHNNATQRIQFTNCYPISIGGMEFDSAVTDITYITADVEFRFVDMKFL